jgi:hypothetical protein
VVVLACLPYVRVPVWASPAFVAVYNAVSTLNDLTTPIILFSQFNILRSRALLLLPSGCLFASLISIVQLLTFWHGGFPLVVISYAIFHGPSWSLSRRRLSRLPRPRPQSSAPFWCAGSLQPGYRLCDITLASYLNGGRYDLGFCAGRIYGALAASFVLAVLVLENGRLYRRLAIAAGRLKERATELLQANWCNHDKCRDLFALAFKWGPQPSRGLARSLV